MFSNKKRSIVFCSIFLTIVAVIFSMFLSTPSFAKTANEDVQSVNETNCRTQFITHNHSIYDDIFGDYIDDDTILNYYHPSYGPMALNHFYIDNEQGGLVCWCSVSAGSFGGPWFIINTSAGEYIVGIKLNSEDLYGNTSAYFQLETSEDPEAIPNTIEFIFSTTPPPEIDTPTDCTFNANGGTFPSTSKATEVVSEKYFNKYILPTETPVKEGLNFKNWLDVENNIVTEDNTFTKTENTNFKAQWVANLEYNLNGGQGQDIPMQEYEENATVTLNAGEGITREGYILEGWNTSSDGTGTHYDLGSQFKIDRNTKLYAQWTKEVINIEITGTVTDSNNSPVEGALCEFIPNVTANSNAPKFETYSDIDGFFKLVVPNDIKTGKLKITKSDFITMEKDIEIGDLPIDLGVVKLEPASDDPTPAPSPNNAEYYPSQTGDNNASMMLLYVLAISIIVVSVVARTRKTNHIK